MIINYWDIQCSFLKTLSSFSKAVAESTLTEVAKDLHKVKCRSML